MLLLAVFTLMLLYRKQSMQTEESFQILQFLLATNYIDILVGDFNHNLLKVSERHLLDTFTHHIQKVIKPTHISRSLIDHVYIRKTLMEESSTNVSVKNIYFLDDDSLRNAIEKNVIDFQMTS